MAVSNGWATNEDPIRSVENNEADRYDKVGRVGKHRIGELRAWRACDFHHFAKPTQRDGPGVRRVLSESTRSLLTVGNRYLSQTNKQKAP